MEDINEIIINELKQMNEDELLKMLINSKELVERSKKLKNSSVVKKCIQFNTDLIKKRLEEIVNNK